MQHVFKKSNRGRVAEVLILTCIIIGLLWQVGQLARWVPFHDWDEAIYAQVAKEFVRAPQGTLTYNGAPWFEKPPLPTLLYAIAWVLPLQPELVARMISVVISTIALLALYHIMKHLKMHTAIVLLVLMITVQSAMYRDRSVLINVDIMLTAGWLVYLLGRMKEHAMLKTLGLLVGVWSKSFLGFFPFIADVGVSIITGKVKRRKVIEWIGMTAVALSWHMYMMARYGMPFIQSHFLDHLVARVVRPIELHFGGKWFYLDKLWSELHVFGILAVLGIGIWAFQGARSYLKKGSLPRQTSHLLALALVPLTYFALLTVSKSKLHWYTTPLIPFVAFWGGIFIQRTHELIPQKYKKIIDTVVIFAVVISLLLFAQSSRILDLKTYISSEKTKMGQCVSANSDKSDRLAYVLSPLERQDNATVEAAQLQIGSSFIYGSAPAFLYYADIPVQFVYRIENLPAFIDQATILVFDVDDAESPFIQDVAQTTEPSLAPSAFCRTTHKVAYRLR